MIINLEGVDATGKSTIARLLAKRLGGAYYSTPPQSFLEQREKIDSFASPEEHYLFYLKGLFRS